MIKMDFAVPVSEIKNLISQEGKDISGLYFQFQQTDKDTTLYIAGEESGGKIDLKQQMIILKPLGNASVRSQS